jgi:hypothetical protein
MFDNHKEGYILGCGTTGEGDHNFQLENGLAKSHAYAIVDVRFLTGHKGEKIRALKIKNPWSVEKYHGALSDLDKDFWDK